MTEPTSPIDDTTAPETQALPAALEQEATPTGSRSRRRRIVWGSVAGGLAVLLASGGLVAAQAHKLVTIEADGTSLSTGSFRGTVAGLLEDQGITLGEHDEISPALDVELSDGTAVEILRAAPIEIVLDGEETTHWTTADDAGAALAAFSLEGRDVAMSVSRSAGRVEMDLPLSSSTLVHEMNGDRKLTLPEGMTLDAALTSTGLTLGDLDEITVASEADGTSVVTIVRVAVTERVENEAVPFTSTEVSSDEFYVGTTQVTTAGVDGNIERKYQVTTRDGEEISAELTSEATTVEMVQEVVTTGSKKRPVVVKKPVASSSGSSGGSSSGSGSGSGGSSSEAPVATVTGDVWAALAKCESGGNPSAVSSSGKYHGLYQFSVSTWQAMGGSGLPSEASASEQTQRAQALQARSGWGQWPHCSSKLGLR